MGGGKILMLVKAILLAMVYWSTSARLAHGTQTNHLLLFMVE